LVRIKLQHQVISLGFLPLLHSLHNLCTFVDSLDSLSLFGRAPPPSRSLCFLAFICSSPPTHFCTLISSLSLSFSPLAYQATPPSLPRLTLDSPPLPTFCSMSSYSGPGSNSSPRVATGFPERKTRDKRFGWVLLHLLCWAAGGIAGDASVYERPGRVLCCVGAALVTESSAGWLPVLGALSPTVHENSWDGSSSSTS